MFDIFAQNKYLKYYKYIINTAQARTEISSYTEKHHIIPKCLDGTNDSENLVIVTDREHFLCHWLLTKMSINEYQFQKLNHAFSFMLTENNNQTRYIPSPHLFSKLKIKSSSGRVAPMLGKHHSDETKKKISDSMIGYSHSEKTKRKMSSSKHGSKNSMFGKSHDSSTKSLISTKRIGTNHSDETKKKISESLTANHPMRGKTHSINSKEKMRIAKLGVKQPNFLCPHCDRRIGGKGNFTRFHNDNCPSAAPS